MILIDTHVLIWWADGNQQRLSQQALAAIEVEIEGDGNCFPLALQLVRTCTHAELRSLAATHAGVTANTATMRKHELQLAKMVAPRLQCTRSS